MTIDDEIRGEKLQYNINREAAKIWALSSGKIHKCECLTGEDILPSNQQQIIEQAKFTCSPLGKAFDKQIKIIEDQGKKQVDVLNTLKSDNNKKLEIKNENIIPKSSFGSDEAKEEINKIKEIEKTIDREKLIYDASEYTYNFRNFRTIRAFDRDIYEGKITLKKADEDQSNLLNEIKNFRDKTRPQKYDKKQEKEIALKNLYEFYGAREIILDGFNSKVFLTKSTGTSILNTDRSKFKILTPKQMLRKFFKWNQANCLFFISIKRNHQKSIQ